MYMEINETMEPVPHGPWEHAAPGQPRPGEVWRHLGEDWKVSAFLIVRSEDEETLQILLLDDSPGHFGRERLSVVRLERRTLAEWFAEGKAECVAPTLEVHFRRGGRA